MNAYSVGVRGEVAAEQERQLMDAGLPLPKAQLPESKGAAGSAWITLRTFIVTPDEDKAQAIDRVAGEQDTPSPGIVFDEGTVEVIRQS